jgi:hypothetical protein
VISAILVGRRGQREVLPVLVSTTQFEETGLAACLGLGIHSIAPSLRPLPVLRASAKCGPFVFLRCVCGR